MSRSLSFRQLFSAAFILSVCLLIALVPQTSFATGNDDDSPLDFFKNYFVTGDYVAGGVGMGDLRGKGVLINPTNPKLTAWKGTYTTATINVGGTGPNGSSPIPTTNGLPADI